MKTNLLLSGLLGCAALVLPVSANTIADTPDAVVEQMPANIVLTPDSLVLAQLDADDDGDDEKAPGKKKSKSRNSVSAALADVEFLTHNKPNPRAKYYIYLCSASWCGPCNAEMPHVVKAYKSMKKDKVELILVSADRSSEEAVAFLEKYNAKFPAIMSTSSKHLPGFTPPSGIPHAIIVDAEGNVLHTGHGSHALKWSEYTGSSKKSKAAKAKDKKSKREHDDED